jgi:hypothetical protein
MNNLRHFLWPTLLALGACIQTEIIPEVLEPTLILSQSSLSLAVGQSATLEAQYTDEQYNDLSQLITWSMTAPQIATTTPQGVVSGLAPGQAWAIATAPGKLTDSVLITVVQNSSAVASVEILNPPANMTVADNAALQARVLNASGQVLTGKTVLWSSNNAAVLSLTPGGNATALSAGSAQVTANAEGVNSLPVTVQVIPQGGQSRSGNFSSNGGYSVKGTATLKQNGNSLSLTLEDNFMCSSGPQLGVYLAKSASGALNSQNSLFLNNLQSTMGMQTYNVPPGVALSDYNYAVIYCIPFTVRFGTAPLN